MLNNQISVNVEFVIDALQARYDDVCDQWSNEASESLWEKVLDLVRECGIISCASSHEYVDNYLIKGEFINKGDDVDIWLDKTSFNEYCEVYNLTESEVKDLKESPMFSEFWDEYCQDHALIYNDEYACLSF